MDGEQDGVQGRQTEGQEGIRPARDGGRQEPQVGGTDSVDFAAQLKAKDAEIEALQAKVAEAAKTAEATEALAKAEPWLFEGAEPTSQRTSQTSAGGAMGPESAGVAGGNDATYMRRWERIAGPADEGKEG